MFLRVLLAVDVVLDLLFVSSHLDGLWTGWCLLLRAACAVWYFAMFVKFAVAGGVVSSSSLSSLSSPSTSALLYVFLWALM